MRPHCLRDWADAIGIVEYAGVIYDFTHFIAFSFQFLSNYDISALT